MDTHVFDMLCDYLVQEVSAWVLRGDGVPSWESMRDLYHLSETCRRMYVLCLAPVLWCDIDPTALLREHVPLHICKALGMVARDMQRNLQRVLPHSSLCTSLKYGMNILSDQSEVVAGLPKLQELMLRGYMTYGSSPNALHPVVDVERLRLPCLRRLELRFACPKPPRVLPPSLRELLAHGFDAPAPVHDAETLHYPGITKLSLHMCGGYTAPLIRACPNLEELDIVSFHGTNGDMQDDGRSPEPDVQCALHRAIRARGGLLRVLQLRTHNVAPAWLFERAVDTGGFPLLDRLRVCVTGPDRDICGFVARVCPSLRALAIERDTGYGSVVSPLDLRAMAGMPLLTDLELPLTMTTGDALAPALLQLARSDGVPFESLTFRFDPDGPNVPKGFWLGRRCSRLRRVRLWRAPNCHTDQLARAAAETLETFELTDCTHFCKREQRDVLSKCANLRRLRIQVGDRDAMRKTARVCVATDLRDVALCDTEYTQPEGVRELLSSMKNLTRLSLGYEMDTPAYATIVIGATRDCPYLQQIFASPDMLPLLRDAVPSRVRLFGL